MEKYAFYHCRITVSDRKQIVSGTNRLYAFISRCSNVSLRERLYDPVNVGTHGFPLKIFAFLIKIEQVFTAGIQVLPGSHYFADNAFHPVPLNGVSLLFRHNDGIPVVIPGKIFDTDGSLSY